MSLTGQPFFLLLVALVLVALAATLWSWGHLRGPQPLRVLQRLALLIVCQVCAIALTATWVNNHYGLYASWDDLLGRDSSSRLVMAGPPPQTAKFTKGIRGTVQTYFRGPKSELAGQVDVWVPPQYRRAADRHTRFPVLTLLSGYPGDSQTWVLNHGLLSTVTRMMGQGAVPPAIIVMPTVAPGGVDTDCSDTPESRVASWMAKDVPDLIRRHFRTQDDPRAWAVAGMSTGGICAIKLPMQYPRIFGIGAGMDSDPFTGDPAVLPETQLRVDNSPVHLAGRRPDVRLYASTSAQDAWSPPSHIQQLRRAIRPPTTLAPAYILPTGGHNNRTVAAELPPMLQWLNTVLARPANPRHHAN